MDEIFFQQLEGREARLLGCRVVEDSDGDDELWADNHDIIGTDEAPAKTYRLSSEFQGYAVNLYPNVMLQSSILVIVFLFDFIFLFSFYGSLGA